VPDVATAPALVPPRPWTWLHQVHGDTVVTVRHPGEHAGARADAAVTTTPGCVLMVRTADCVPIVLRAGTAVGVVHAGWQGLSAGVVAAAAIALRRLDPTAPMTATVGPSIRAGCYEFGAVDLDRIAARWGDRVRATTLWGTPALDLVGGVRRALDEVGATTDDSAGCTACDDRWFSHRARAEAERFATFAWLEAAP
jgi:YfiH family protein